MGFLAQIADEWRDRRERSALISSLAFVGPDQLRAIAADVGLTPDELRLAARSGATTAGLLDRMLKARGLAASAIPPVALRQIEADCTRCTSRARCREELDAGTAAVNAEQFCPNSRAITELLVATTA